MTVNRSVARARACVRMRIVCCVVPFGWAANAADDSLQTQIRRLWIQASDGAVRHRDMVAPSRDSLSAMGLQAIPYLLPHLHTEDARERHTITDIFKEMGSVAVRPLLDVLGDGDEYHTANTLWALGKIGDTEATPGMIPFLADSIASVRDKASESIGKCGGPLAAGSLYGVLRDEHESVRKSAVVGLGRLQAVEAADSLIAALDDVWFGVRYAAAEALVALDSGETAADRVRQLEDRPLALVAGALSRMPGKHARSACHDLWDHPDYRVRAASLRGLIDRKVADRYLSPLSRQLQRETHPLVQSYLQRILSGQP